MALPFRDGPFNLNKTKTLNNKLTHKNMNTFENSKALLQAQLDNVNAVIEDKQRELYFLGRHIQSQVERRRQLNQEIAALNYEGSTMHLANTLGVLKDAIDFDNNEPIPEPEGGFPTDTCNAKSVAPAKDPDDDDDDEDETPYQKALNKKRDLAKKRGY